ncbi:MAG: DNA-protecting protein DprA, partial [Propionibacteriaceae bacterium]|nr:DNA-protecting protein DprA [Propionibacteriaceae bacterium]
MATNSQRYGKLDLDQVQRSAAHHGIRFIIPGDDEWPTGLAQLAGVDNGNGCGGVPAGLWVKGGGHLGALSRHSVAIFGSRAATAYGEHATAKFSAEISEAGVLVVSGGAFGIDAAAHRAALAVAAPTAAVLGCGLDMAYPPSNGKLFDRIAEQGVLVSEVPPGTHPTRALLLSRNRLIPALSQASV